MHRSRYFTVALLVISMLLFQVAFLELNDGITEEEMHQISEDTNRSDLALVQDESISNGFIENLGQIENDDVLFYSRAPGLDIGLTHSGPIYVLHGDEGSWASRMVLEGSNMVTPESVEEVGPVSNFFIGNDEAKHVTGVRTFKNIIFRNIYPNIDLIYRSDRGLKYDLVVRPGGDPELIRMRYKGAESEIVDEELNLITPVGRIIDSAPFTYDEDNTIIPSSWKANEDGTFGYWIDGHDPTKTFTIDPMIIASTYLGGSWREYSRAICTDSKGDVYAVGRTQSNNFPTTVGAYDTTHNNNYDVYVTKFNSSLDKLLFSTFFGGSGDDWGNDIKLTSDGDIIFVGWTYSSNFPTTSGAYDQTYNGYQDGFIVKLNGTDSSLIFSTYLGGYRDEYFESVDIDSNDNPVIIGFTYSYDYPSTPGAYDTAYYSSAEVVVTKLNNSGSSLDFSTFIGGSTYDYGHDIFINRNDTIYATGYTFSYNFPTTSGAYDTTLHDDSDGFVVKLNPQGSSLLASTYIGGIYDDNPERIILDSNDNVFITGNTERGIPVTSGAYDTSFNGGKDAFVSKLTSNLNSLIMSTFIGGSYNDYGKDILLDEDGRICITGWTDSYNYPLTTDAFDTSRSGYEGLITVLSSDGSKLEFSSYLGGYDSDYLWGIDMDPNGIILVTGYTFATDFVTTPGAYSTSNNGNMDTVITKLFMLNGVPRNLQATSGYMYVNLTWDVPDSRVTSSFRLNNYTIYKGTSPSWLSLYRTIGNMTYFNDTILDYEETTYYYAIGAVYDIVGESGRTENIMAAPLIPPKLSTNSTSGRMFVNLTWNTLPAAVTSLYDVTKYNVYRGRYNDALEVIAEETDRTFYNDTDIPSEPTTYYYCISYVLSGVGEGKPSNLRTEKPITPPSEPANVQCRLLKTEIEVKWSLPSDNGGSAVTGFIINRGESHHDMTTLSSLPLSARAYIDKDILPGKHYFYSLTATNDVGPSKGSEPQKVYTYSTPSCPTSFNAFPTDKTVHLQWSEPVNTWEKMVLRYYLYRGGAPDDLKVYRMINGDTLEFTDMVENGILNYYGISAETEFGEGEMAGPISSVGSTSPGKINNVSIGTGDEMVVLNWDPPLWNGGSGILYYTVYRGLHMTMNEPVATIPYGSNVFFDERVTNGVTYYYSISSTNHVGESARSGIMSAIPGRYPNVITEITAKPLLKGALLTWGKPVSLGGNVTDYRIYGGSSISSLKSIQVLKDLNGTVIEHEVFGLDNTKTYFFAVSSYNDFGESELSPMVSVSPYGEPGIPEFTKNVSHIEGVELWWKVPEYDGGSNILEFSIMYRKLQYPQWNTVKVSFVDYLNLDYLESGEIYLFKIKARNHVSWGEESEPISVMIGAAPNRISDLSVEYDEGTPTLKWTKPEENGFNIKYYDISFKDNLGKFVIFQRITGLAQGYRLEGLAKGEVYYFAVTAVNGVGEGKLSHVISVVAGSKPDAVQNTWIQEIGPSRVTIAWTYPLDDGGDQISDFNIYRGSEPGTEEIIETVKNFKSFTDKNLVNGQKYYYFVTAINKWGEGSAGPRVSSIPKAPPSSPYTLEIESTTDTVEIKWDPPLDSGGSGILGYLIYKGTDPERMKLFMKTGPNTLKVTDKDVGQGEIYYRVAAFNEMGEGEEIQKSTTVPSRTGMGVGLGLGLLLIPLIIILLWIFVPKGLALLNRRPKEDKMKEAPPPTIQRRTDGEAHFKTFVKPSEIKVAPQPKGLRTHLYDEQFPDGQQMQPQLRPAPMPPYGAPPQPGMQPYPGPTPTQQPYQSQGPIPPGNHYKNLENQPGNMYYKKPENP